MGIIEKMGTEIRLIFDSCEKSVIKRPEYHEKGDFVKIVFFFEPSIGVGKSEKEIILALIKTKHLISISYVTVHLNVSRNTATRKLQKLMDEGKIVRHGKGPSVRYGAKSS